MRKLWFLVPLTGLIVALALSTSASAVRRVKLAAGVSVTQPTVTGTARVGDVVSVGEPAGAVASPGISAATRPSGAARSPHLSGNGLIRSRRASRASICAPR